MEGMLGLIKPSHRLLELSIKRGSFLEIGVIQKPSVFSNNLRLLAVR